MSPEGVHPNEMNEPHDLDDNAIALFLSGGSGDLDPRLSDVIGDIRTAYTSQPPAIGPELSALLAPQPTQTGSFLSRRFEQIRSSMIAKIGIGAAAIVVATGGLATAGTLPARVKDAVSHLGVIRPSHDHPDSPSWSVSATTTTTNPTDNKNGRSPIGVGPASGSGSSADDGGSPPTTIERDATPTTTPDGLDDNGVTPPTTIERDTTPTTTPDGLDDGGGTPPTSIEPDSSPTASVSRGSDLNASAGTDPTGDEISASTSAGDD